MLALTNKYLIINDFKKSFVSKFNKLDISKLIIPNTNPLPSPTTISYILHQLATMQSSIILSINVTTI